MQALDSGMTGYLEADLTPGNYVALASFLPCSRQAAYRAGHDDAVTSSSKVFIQVCNRQSGDCRPDNSSEYASSPSSAWRAAPGI